ncbi:MAG: SGNH/GDSL hydrolase family protein [Chloroflexia bacterium]
MRLSFANKRLQIVLSGFILSYLLLTPYNSTFAAKNIPYTETVDAPQIVDYPNSMASTGDSITRGFNTGATPFTDSPANSWTTGTNASVNTHYLRILSNNPLINAQVNNDAVTGAIMADLYSQATNVVSQGAQYVTILLGANDACADTEPEMTSVSDYRTQFMAGMNTLSTGLPDARIYVLSVPNLYNLWFILKDNASARFTWNLLGICQTMLANPLSTAPADVERRNRVRQRVIDYNTQLAEICASYIHCRFDNNAAFNIAFVPADVSTRDYFHPTITGQAKIAEYTYSAGFDFRDGVAPASVVTLSQQKGTDGSNTLVTITARDNVGVSGIEYKINNGPYTRYATPVSLPAGSNLTYRAVDVNGTIENARTIMPGFASSGRK